MGQGQALIGGDLIKICRVVSYPGTAAARYRLRLLKAMLLALNEDGNEDLRGGSRRLPAIRC